MVKDLEGRGVLRQGKKVFVCACGMGETALYSLIKNLAFEVAELILCRSHTVDINLQSHHIL